MDQVQLIRITTTLEHALAPEIVNERARTVGFLKRLRCITPHRLALSLILTLATQQIDTLADLLRGFAAATQLSVTYKSFYKQLAKPAFADFMKSIVELLMVRLVLDVLLPVPESPLTEFRDIKAHDSTEFKLPDWFQKCFPGRFPVKAPAVAALHTTLSLRRDQPVQINLSPQRDAARDYRPEPGTLIGDLFLGDRAYADCLYVETVDKAGGSCLIRATKRINPKVLAGVVGKERWTLAHGKKFQELLAHASGVSLDLDVEFQRSKRRPHKVQVRLVALWNPVTGAHVLLLTNLDRGRFPLAFLGEMYRLRWQVELLFKEWKSYANLHAFTTENEALATGLIWASLAAAFLKRFCAHATARVFPAVVISTRRAAMGLSSHLRDVVYALVREKPLYQAVKRMLDYLREYGQRANVKRDDSTGRGRTGLHPVGRKQRWRLDDSIRSSGTFRPIEA